MHNSMKFDEILAVCIYLDSYLIVIQYINDLSGRIDLDQMFLDAEELVYQAQALGVAVCSTY